MSHLIHYAIHAPVPDGAVGLPEVSHDLPCTKAASRYVQVQLRMWTLPVALRTIGRYVTWAGGYFNAAEV